MSDYLLKIIPVDPDRVPEAALLDTAVVYVRSVVDMEVECFWKIDDTIQFRDCGENFEKVSCPKCRSEISITSWQEWMDEDWDPETGFRLRQRQLDCCNVEVTLNDLDYSSGQGFSRFCLCVRNSLDGFEKAAVSELSLILGCTLRTIHCRI